MNKAQRIRDLMAAGMDADAIEEATGFDRKYISSTIWRARKDGVDVTLKGPVFVRRTRLVMDEVNPYGADVSEPISVPEKAAAVATKVVGDEAQEVLIVICLDAHNQVTAIAEVGRGTADKAPYHPRDVFRPAILSNALKILVAHNHPSGNTEPSEADKRMTLALAEQADLMRIPLVDSLIVNERGEYVSLRERGYI